MDNLIAHHRNPNILAYAIACILFMTSSVAGQGVDTIRVNSELVSLNVVVMNRQGRPVSGLTREDFEVYEDGKRQEITHFSTNERSLRLVLLFDTSISMEAVLPQVKQEATALIGRLRAEDEVSIVSFAADVRSLANWVKADEADRVVGNITSEEHPQPVAATPGRPGYRVGDGNTNLYEGLKYVLTRFKGDSNDRIAVVVFSDGVDTAAGRSLERIRQRASEIGGELRRYAQESWALLYPIRYRTEQVIGDMPEPAWRATRAIRLGSRPPDPGRELFSQIATASGGEVFEWTTQSDLALAIEGVLMDLRNQYGIGYKPPSSAGRTRFHRVKIKVKRPDMVARAREGYLITGGHLILKSH